MKKKGLVIALVCILIIGIVFAGGAWWYFGFFNSSTRELDEPIYSALDRKKQEERASANEYTIKDKYSDVKITDWKSAVQSLEDIADILDIADVQNEFVLFNENKFENNAVYKLSQVYKGVPVNDKMVIVVADNEGNSSWLTSSYFPIKEFDINPILDEDQAVNIAMQCMKRKYNCKEKSISNSTPELVIETILTEEPTLTYIVEISGENKKGGLVAKELYINANTGEIYKVSNTVYSMGKYFS